VKQREIYMSGNPCKLIEVSQDGQGVRMGNANFGVVVKQVCLEYTSEVNAGDYVLVHVGFALDKVDEEKLAEQRSPASLSCAEEDSYEIPR
jgi:hydrogenase expression/formation protein HypC